MIRFKPGEDARSIQSPPHQVQIARQLPSVVESLPRQFQFRSSSDWFLGRAELATAMWRLFASSRLATLSTLVKPQSAVQDADRREEFVRLCLAELGLRPAGEGQDQAADRLTTLDSAARTRVLRQTAAAERRAREIREAMAQKAAQESASRYGE